MQEDLQGLTAYARSGGSLDIGNTLFGSTPLMYALTEGKKSSYSELMRLGADPNSPCRYGAAVVNKAATQNDPQWLQIALAARGNPNLVIVDAFSGISYEPPLFWAMHEGRIENVKMLCDAGANINVVDRYDTSVLADAWAHAEFEIVYYLLNRGADYNPPCPRERSFVELLRLSSPDLWRSVEGKGEWYDKVFEWFSKRNIDLNKAVWNRYQWEFAR